MCPSGMVPQCPFAAQPRVFHTSEFPPLERDNSAGKDVSRSPLTGSVQSDNSLPSQVPAQAPCVLTLNP